MDQLKNYILNQRNLLEYVCGDFNLVSMESKRKCRGGLVRNEDIRNFNNFIKDYVLVNFPINMRCFTWFLGDKSVDESLGKVSFN